MDKPYHNIPDDSAMVSEPAIAYGRVHAPVPVFSKYQMQILDSIANVKNEQELCDIKNLIAEYFLSTETIQSWQSGHMRTPYKY